MRADAGEAVGKRKHLFLAGETAQWYSHNGNERGYLLRKLGTDLPQDPALPRWAYAQRTPILQGYKLTYVHFCSIHNGQKLEKA